MAACVPALCHVRVGDLYVVNTLLAYFYLLGKEDDVVFAFCVCVLALNRL